MKTYNIHEGKTKLFRLIEQAAAAEPFIIGKASKPLVNVMAVDAPEPSQRERLGFMRGEILVPDGFDRLGGAEIEKMFGKSV